MKYHLCCSLKTTRNHWGVGNGLYWRLDVDFQEDKSKRKKNAAVNFSLKRKRQRAALSEECLRDLLGSRPLKTIFQRDIVYSQCLADFLYKAQKKPHGSFEVICGGSQEYIHSIAKYALVEIAP